MGSGHNFQVASCPRCYYLYYASNVIFDGNIAQIVASGVSGRHMTALAAISPYSHSSQDHLAFFW